MIKNILSFTTFLPSPVIPRENDISLRIYKALEGRFRFSVFKSLNVLPFFDKRHKIYKQLKKDGSYIQDTFNIAVYTLPNLKDPLPIKVIYLKWLYILFVRKKIKKQLAGESIAAVHSNNIFPDFFMGYYASKDLGIPHLCTLRGKNAQIEAFLSLHKKYYEGTRFCTPTPGILSLFERKKIPVTFIPHGIPSSFFYEPEQVAPQEELRFIIVNRLLKMKRISSILDFFHSLAAAGIPFRCDIIGEGDQRVILEQQVQDAGLQSKIQFHGHQGREFIAQQLRTANFYITNSESETFGLSIVEAMAAGCLIVSPGNIGVVNLFNDREFFVEFTSDYNRLKNTLLEKSEDLHRLKKAAYTYALNFTWEKMIDRYTDFFITE